MAEAAERRLRLGHEIVDVLGDLIGRPSTAHAAKAVDPAARLRERHAHEVAPAVARATSQSDHRAERGEISRAVIDDLSGKMLGAIEPAAEAVFVRHAGDCLDQRLEPAALSPGPGVTIRRESDVDDAGSD